MTMLTHDTTTTPEAVVTTPQPEASVTLGRRTIDGVLVSIGAVLTAALLVAAALLTWGSNFADDYVHDELSSQNITFPPAAVLVDQGRADLAKYGDATVDTGGEAEAYASFINGHLESTADGATYADLGGPEREASTAVEAAQAAGASDAAIAALQAKADTISGQRDTLFKGETLRGLLLTSFAWATVGRIAGIAAIAAFAAGGVMLILVVLGLRHHRKVAVHKS